MPRFILLALFLSAGLLGYGQNSGPPDPPPARNAVYTELGGPGLWLSVNYDRRFKPTNDGWGWHAGIGSNFGTQPTGVTIPVGVNWLGGHKGNFIEFGAGAAWFNLTGLDFNHRYNFGNHNKTWSQDVHSPMGNLTLGYRRQPKHGGLNLRAGITEFVGAGTAGLIPYFGLGYGF
jgi:hypothetical protein